LHAAHTAKNARRPVAVVRDSKWRPPSIPNNGRMPQAKSGAPNIPHTNPSGARLRSTPFLSQNEVNDEIAPKLA